MEWLLIDRQKKKNANKVCRSPILLFGYFSFFFRRPLLYSFGGLNLTTQLLLSLATTLF